MLGGEEELPAARAAIQFAYTGRVQEGLSVREALQLYGCAALWPDPAEDPAFGALLAEAKRRLVAHFGDALAVLNGRERYEQLLALPAAGLEALLESDDFGTDSESSVVLLLAEWVGVAGGAGKWMAAAHSRTDEATRRRLCGLLRLAQCSRTYLSWVLPALAARHEASPGSAAGWLPEKETSAEQPGGAASAPDSSSGVAARWGRYLQGGTRLAGSITLRPPPPP
ncbi:hypothetical protein HXX76_009715 [Chlamydomonas incerta]|uniref:BACK domain-containing protein n=1 Tax=Chlamydomonas incerta TaxID=51695 RepID=A0A835VVS7_CHLIN|nr:hypothetical protein HXX76_009715 [Chlamydomonas incerta]|eukprot:KAG2431187.1 hypothetical protein HXX76_009715 [Chlamydomonas incerta]